MEAIQRIKHFPKLFVSSRQLYYPKSQMPELEEKHNHILQRGSKITRENGKRRQNLVEGKISPLCSAMSPKDPFVFNSLFILSGSLLLSCFAMENLSLFHGVAGKRGTKRRGWGTQVFIQFSQWPKLSSLDKYKSHCQNSQRELYGQRTLGSLFSSCRAKMGT